MDEDILEQEKNHNWGKKNLVLLILLIICLIVIIILSIVIAKKENDDNSDGIKGYDYWDKKYDMIATEDGKYLFGLYASSFNVNLTEHEGERLATSTCYYLVKTHQPYPFHRLKGDECFLFHDGTPLTIYIINEETGKLEIKYLGLCEKCEPLICIKENNIFAQINEEQYTFASVQTIPGYDDRDCKIFNKAEMLELYPNYTDIINIIYPK